MSELTYDHLMSYPVPEAEQTVTPTDCILYALSLGFGSDPTHPGHLRYVYEDDLHVLPMMANVIGYPGFWIKAEDTRVDWKRVLHGEQAITIHRPLPTSADLVGRTRVTGINDKGEEKGAFVYSRRDVVDRHTDEPVCSLEQTSVLRGNGGCGGDDAPPRPPHRLPERDPDIVCDLAIPPNAALIYRLNGDRNPLHADPAVAIAAGFDQPILHGMCTMGYAGHAIIASVCDYDGDRMRFMSCRFTAPVFPGETLRSDIWIDGEIVSYRTTALERGVTVLGNGRVELTEGAS